MFSEKSPASSRVRHRSSTAGGRAGAAAATRRAIVEAARRICFADGPGALTARGLAAEAGLSAAAIYLHFPSLELVLHELRMEGHGLLTRYLRRPAQELPIAERAVAMGLEYHRFGRENPNLFALMFLAPVARAALGELVAAEGASLDVVRQAFATAIERGELAAGSDALLLANVAWMSVHGITSMVVSGHAEVTAPGREAELLDCAAAATRAWILSMQAAGGPRPRPARPPTPPR